MESSTDHYLHKKFKKQLSIEPRSQQHNDKENKDSVRTESREEKIECGSHEERQSEEKTWNSVRISENQRTDNNDSVPNQSTNQHNPSFSLNSIFSKSSISVENREVESTTTAYQQSSNSGISYVVSNHSDEHLPTSFDTKFCDQPTNYSVSASSILDDIYSRQNYVNSEDMYHHSPVPYNLHHNVQDYSQKTNCSEEPSDSKLEEIHPPPDKNSSGKYVCPYCSLVCSKPSVLQKHIRAHTNERPYPCKSCGFSFKTRSNLYKHCRSRTHANRVMGNKTQDPNSDAEPQKPHLPQNQESKEEQTAQKPYKPRFHTAKEFFETVSKDIDEEFHNNRHPASEMLTQHINEIISKNNCIVNDSSVKKRINEDCNNETRYNQNEPSFSNNFTEPKSIDEPLNLTNKNRKRSLSEVTEPVIQKSLIKELLLKNLSASDMQCPHCKMIFQTVTELDVHKYRSCKGNPAGAKYTRSSSVNVASILTQNKNAFDNIPHLQNTVFPLNSPGPFLGKTRLVDGDKSKSFSFDNCNMPLASPNEPSPSPNYLLSPLSFDKEKKSGLKLFGGEVKVQSSGETKSFKIDGKEEKYQSDSSNIGYGGKLSENRVIKSSLQSGGTVLTNKTNYSKHDMKVSQEVIRVYENTLVSPSIDISNFSKSKFTFDRQPELPDRGADSILRPNATSLCEPQKLYSPQSTSAYKYTNIMDFSQKAVQKLTPNIKQPHFTTTSIPISKYSNIIENKTSIKSVECDPMLQIVNTTGEVEVKKPFLPSPRKLYYESKPTTPTNLYNPLKLLVNGKVVRHVPGMPGPVAPDSPGDVTYGTNIIAVGVNRDQDLTPSSPLLIAKSPLTPKDNFLQPEKVVERLNRSPKLDILEVKTDFSTKSSELKIPVRVSESESSEGETKKFVRPNSLALKPTTASLKQHHGLTPTKFNQILISPDTPRVAKKYAELFLHGNYFSYLGLKSSTKPVYCTLNKTQPFYVHHFKKLSMYSEWRQQDTKQDKLYVSNYDARQKSQRYSVAGKTTANLIIHSSYKFMVSELPSSKSEKDDQQKANSVLGGYECNDDYTYIRGRGRGRYVCDQCGIRCKKPSMLKKHIRTHSNDRPYTCSHCNFSFKTKGNLTKHMKSKAHTKNYTASGSSGSSTQQSVHSSDSDTEDSGMDSSDESTRQQEHEAAYGLLSLSQKPTPSSTHTTSDLSHLRSSSPNDLFMSTEEIAFVSKTNYAKNKILDERNSLNFTSRKLNEVPAVVSTMQETMEVRNVTNFLGKCSVNRPLTYPYTSILSREKETLTPNHVEMIRTSPNNLDISPEPKSIKQFHVIQKYMPQAELSSKLVEPPVKESSPRKTEQPYSVPENVVLNNKKNINLSVNRVLPTLKLNDVVITTEKVSDLRKRKFTTVENLHKNKIQRNDEVMDLSMATVQEKLERVNGLDDRILNNVPRHPEPQKNVANEIYNTLQKIVPTSPQGYDVNEDREENISYKSNDSVNNNGTVIILRPLHLDDPNINYVDRQCNSDDQTKINDYDNSAMETLADIATKQVKLEKNMLAKSVATEFLKLATKNENMDGCRESGGFSSASKDVNDIIVKSEGNKSCTICSKSFNKPSQLRLHMNIHYLERPFRCDSCSVSFRTKGHLQKHERSAGHHTKLSSSPAMSTSEPRPFKCTDCNIAFRIHGHLAKHLRSKLHIMKLECLAKIPFGLYAELERSNSLLTEINTCDGDQCLESLKTLAKKVFINDPSKLNHLEITEHVSADC